MKLDELNGKVVVITGASSGFGHGAALKFADAGASVVLAARSSELLDQTAAMCHGKGVRALPVPTDVSNHVDVARLAEAALNTFGRFDVWVNDAGVGAIGRFTDIPLEDHEKVIQTNLLGVIYGSYFAMRQFRSQQSGVLINIASALGKIPAPYYASYTASKFAVVGLGGSLRQELAQDEIRGVAVSTIMPMAHDTPFFEHAANYTGHQAVPIPPTYDPELTIDTIIEMAINPEDEVIVGPQGKIFNAFHNIMPRMIEKLMGKNTHKAQIEEAIPAPTTQGSLNKPANHR